MNQAVRSSSVAVLSITLAAGCGTTVDETATPPVHAPTTPAPPVTPAPPIPPPAAATPSTCTTPFTVPPPYQDTWIDDAAATPGHDLGEWSTRPMRGPVADRDQLQPGCKDRHHTAAPPFAEIVHCTTGDETRAPGPDNLPDHVLLARTDRGWWAHTLARTRWPHRREELVQLAHVTQVTAADLLGDGGAEITALAAVGPPGGAKSRHAFICGLGPSGAPACADIRIAAGGPFHAAGSLLYKLTVTCDGTLTIAGWEGGTPARLIHGHATLAFR